MSRKFTLLAMVLLLIGLAGGRSGTASASPDHQAGSAQSWTVLVGGQGEIEQTEHGPAGAWQFMKFYPNRVTVNVGDTIVWKLNAAEMEQHTEADRDQFCAAETDQHTGRRYGRAQQWVRLD